MSNSDGLDKHAERRRRFLKQAVLTAAAAPVGGLLMAELIAPADAQVFTTRFPSRADDPFPTGSSFTTRVAASTSTLFRTGSEVFTTCESPTESVAERSMSSHSLLATGVAAAAALNGRLRSRMLIETTRSDTTRGDTDKM
jgi:hypothetical protein